MIENNHATLPAVVVDWAAAHKEETGKEPEPKSIKIAASAYVAGLRMADMGRDDRHSGRVPLDLADFENALATAKSSLVSGARECGIALAQLFYENYRIGYSSEGK